MADNDPRTDIGCNRFEAIFTIIEKKMEIRSLKKTYVRVLRGWTPSALHAILFQRISGAAR